ncbi:securin-like isoform X2 [Ambystoma mexicanum]|uniref:securin-like isoform X2 n=2 Tax=Ambystoma mexicanum TaxID=8296 RepID=UPI0037E951D2
MDTLSRLPGVDKEPKDFEVAPYYTFSANSALFLSFKSALCDCGWTCMDLSVSSSCQQSFSMATLIFVDQENGAASRHGASKDRMRLPSSTKVFSEQCRTQGLHPGKVNAAPSARKALCNANVNLGKVALVSKPKQTKKPKEVKTSVKIQKAPSDEYPEIEKCIPYNPLDFECFDVPEEHRLSHLCLAGVPLQTLESNRFDRLVNLLPSPLKPYSFTWESELLYSPFRFSLNKEPIDLPPMWEV